MDMIPFGQLAMMSPPSKDPGKDVLSKGDVALAGKGVTRWCQLSKPQMKTFITMRALAASPLMMGGDLPTLDDFSLMLITDPEMLACNQNGVMGSLVLEKDGLETWKVEKKASKGEGWVGVFNRTDEKNKFELTAERLGLDGTDYTLTEVWSDDVKTFGQTIKLNANGLLFVKYSR
jgi:alpha-galactosidase